MQSRIVAAAAALTIRADPADTPRAEDSGAACLGNPLAACRGLVEALGTDGARLAPGDVILAGALAAPVAMRPGMTYSVSLSELGTFRVRT